MTDSLEGLTFTGLLPIKSLRELEDVDLTMTIRGSGDPLVLMMLRSKEANLLINWGRGDARTQDNEDVG